MTMRYRIENKTSGACLGTFGADSPEGALEAMAREAGYASYAEACEVTQSGADDLAITEDVITDKHNLILCRSDNGDGGWSLHPPGTTDEQIANGEAPVLLSGTAELLEDGSWSAPTQDDYDRAAASLQIAR